jgi:mannosyltransferase
MMVKRKEILILALCLLVGFALRFYGFDHKSLWVDEVHTFNDSRDGFKAQIEFYKKSPTYLHPPFFFVLTHLFYPFTNPERDLRIIPLIFGILSIPMIYFLAKSFSPQIALPCAFSLTFMVYHIYFSQEARPYSMVMFLGMGALYFLILYLKTSRGIYLFLAPLCFALLFYISYTAVTFILFSQMLWFHKIRGDHQPFPVSSFSVFNGLLFLFCMPWLLFVLSSYGGQPVMDPHHTEDPGSLGSIAYWMLNDWVSNLPLIIVSVALLVSSPFFSNDKRNTLTLLALLIFPVSALYLFSKFSNITHFFASKYFITLLPLFFISIYLALNAIELKFKRLRNVMRLKLLFAIFFIASNLLSLPFYYRSEKQDFRGLAVYLKDQLRDGDNIFVRTKAYLPGILHYFGAHPKGRHHVITYARESEKGIEYILSSNDPKMTVTVYHSLTCCTQYVADGSRLWIIVEKATAKEFIRNAPCVLKGYFDGSVANFRKFPTDASMYLFLWEPKSPGEKGIDIPMDEHPSPFPSPQRGEGGGEGENIRGKFSDLNCKNLRL